MAAALVGQGFLASSAGAVTTDAWYSAGATSGNSGYNQGESALQGNALRSLHLSWSAGVDASADAPPSVVGGVAYSTADLDSDTLTFSTVTARNAVTGTQLWKTVLPGQDEASLGQGVTVSGSTVLVPIDSTALHAGVLALSAGTGKIEWEVHVAPPPPTLGSQAAVGFSVDANRAYVLDTAGVITAYNATTGLRQWSVNSLSLGSRGARLGFVANAGDVYTVINDNLVALNGASGKPAWTAPVGVDMNSTYQGSLIVGGGQVYVSGSQIAAFPAAGCGKSTCGPLWTSRAGNPAGNSGIIRMSAATYVHVEAAVYPSSGHGYTLQTLSISTGKTEWTAALSTPNDPVIRGGTTVWIIDGDVLKAYPITCASTCNPAKTVAGPPSFWDSGVSMSVSDGSLFVQTESPRVWRRLSIHEG